MDQADKEREERLAALKERGRVLGVAQVERVQARALQEEIMAGNAEIDAGVAEELRLEREINVQVLDPALDTSRPADKVVVNVMASRAE